MPKKFIEKKKILYSTPLLHRSQQDPLIADENAPNRVLNPVQEEESAKERKKRIKEQQKFGIFFKDDENYLQYLKDVNDHTLEWPANAEEEIQAEIERRKAKLNLPVEVFPSEKEDEVGMLSRGMAVSGLDLNLDSDVVAAMDEDFDFDDPNNQLEDNFIELANGEQIDSKFEEHEEDDYFSCSDYEEESEENDEIKSFPNVEKEKVKSQLTHYPMSSSVLERNEQLRLVDAKFEKCYADFDDDKIGAPDSDGETDYTMSERDNARLLEMAEKYEKSLEKVHLPEKDEISVAKTKELITIMNTSSEEEEEEDEDIDDLENEDFHPTSMNTIKYEPAFILMESKNKIEVSKYTGVPKGILGQDKLTFDAVNSLNEKCRDCDDKKQKLAPARSVISYLSALSIRPKNETPEEKRERKKELKEYRRERVKEKKLNKLAFNEEIQKQKKKAFNNQRNVQGNRL